MQTNELETDGIIHPVDMASLQRHIGLCIQALVDLETNVKKCKVYDAVANLEVFNRNFRIADAFITKWYEEDME